MPAYHKDRAQGAAKKELEALAEALIALRKRAGISKSALSINVSGAGCVVVLAMLDGDECARQTFRSEREILDSIRDEDRVWHRCDPDDLRRWFKEARGIETE